ncbi:MAG: DUF2306 domain-containing protein [Anaerolineae bacterium]|nr:DUF2306 domain-containing protein [Anaerolineae bacterium]
MSSLGWTHLVFALVALLAGAAVLLTRKGTRLHRTLGYIYVTSMVSLNVTALFIYHLTGRFNVFHALALVSLVSLALGLGPVLLRRPRVGWLARHARFISGSYVGLVAAAAAEVAARIPLPGWRFGPAVALAALAVTLVGVTLIRRLLPTSLTKLPR